MFVTNCRKIKTDCRGEKEAVEYICMEMESDEWQRREIGSCTVQYKGRLLFPLVVE
jgi:hypothetical protein